MIHLIAPDGKRFQLKADNERAIKELLRSLYKLRTRFRVEETGEKIRLEDIFNYS